MVEPAILASVIVLGGLIAANVKTPFLTGIALIGLFGLAHGYAHGSEAPAGGLAVAFPLGFALTTLGLHLAGLGLGAGLVKLKRPALVRALGAGTAVGGLLLAAAS
jgi:urease accessory protein